MQTLVNREEKFEEKKRFYTYPIRCVIEPVMNYDPSQVKAVTEVKEMVGSLFGPFLIM